MASAVCWQANQSYDIRTTQNPSRQAPRAVGEAIKQDVHFRVPKTINSHKRSFRQWMYSTKTCLKPPWARKQTSIFQASIRFKHIWAGQVHCLHHLLRRHSPPFRQWFSVAVGFQRWFLSCLVSFPCPATRGSSAWRNRDGRRDK